MDTGIIQRLILDDCYLYCELKKLSNEIKIEENIKIEEALKMSAQYYSRIIGCSVNDILFRFYDYADKINYEY